MPRPLIKFDRDLYADLLDFTPSKKVPLARFPAHPQDELIAQYAGQNNLDPDFVKAVIYQESKGNPKAKSKSNAQGLMQLTSKTMEHIGIEPDDVEQNIAGGTLYLSQLLDRYDGDPEAALTAYHSGPTNFNKKSKKIENMGPVGKEYAAKVMKLYKEGIPSGKNWELD